MLVSTVIGRHVPSGPAAGPGFHNIPSPVPGLGKLVKLILYEFALNKYLISGMHFSQFVKNVYVVTLCNLWFNFFSLYMRESKMR